MTSDRARISWDRTREWRSVVAQQGRVTLEADVNEASTIAQEGRREEILDIVGPTGTPDNGYAVSDAGGGAIALSAGTLYLGGWRLELDASLVSSAQPDFLDAPIYEAKDGAEVVLLRAYEQEVVAVEDQALREVALGGPDTAARTRLLQQVIRVPIQATDCATAAVEIGKGLAEQGLSLDPHSLQLLSTARLKVGFVPPDPLPGPCDPPAQGGYLGADNQLIRVTVTDFDPDTGKGTFLWGWNNASFLYRATTAAANTLVLATDPLDAEHTPRVGQPVEVLRTRVALGGADYIAAPEGEVKVLGAPYTPQNRTLTLPSGLPGAYVNDPNGPLFVRLWEAELNFTTGQPTILDPSGLEVTISMTAWPKVTGRPFWTFAVRPSTPIDVYPARYGQAPQPPEGPRVWLAELAVIGWKDEKFQLLEDCRLPFLPLTQQTNDGCCGIVLGPDDLTAGHNLQHVIDHATKDGPATIVLRPGKYLLDEPLRLGPEHHDLVLEGCRDGVVLQAADGAEEAFAEGVIVMLHADQVVLRNLRIEMPLAPWKIPRKMKKSEGAFVSVGIMAVHCAVLRIERCLFRYHIPDGDHLVAVGVYARSECWGLELRDNLFLRDEEYQQNEDIERYLLGYALTPDTSQTTLIARHRRKVSADVAPDAWLDDALIEGNRFDGLTLPVLVMAGLGRIDCSANKVRNCAGGFYFFSSDLGATLELAKEMENQDDYELSMAFGVGLNLDLLRLAARLGQMIPRPAPFAEGQYAKAYKVFSQKIVSLQAQEFREEGRKAYKAFVTGNEAPSPVPAAPAAPQPSEKLIETVEIRATEGLKEKQPEIKARREALDQVYHVALQSRLLGTDSRPVLRIRSNDIEATGHPLRGSLETPDQTKAEHRAQLEAKAKAKAEGKEYVDASAERAVLGLTAINAVFEYRDDAAQVMLQDNRVSLGTQSACAAAILLPNLAVATGNLLVQPNDPIHRRIPCFILVADFEGALLDVMGNLIKSRSIIRPERSTGADTESWDFLNTTR